MERRVVNLRSGTRLESTGRTLSVAVGSLHIHPKSQILSTIKRFQNLNLFVINFLKQRLYKYKTKKVKPCQDTAAEQNRGASNCQVEALCIALQTQIRAPAK